MSLWSTKLIYLIRWDWSLQTVIYLNFCNITRLKSISHLEIDAKILLVMLQSHIFHISSHFLVRSLVAEFTLCNKWDNGERRGMRLWWRLTRIHKWSHLTIFSLHCEKIMYKTQGEFPYPSLLSYKPAQWVFLCFMTSIFSLLLFFGSLLTTKFEI